MTVTQTPTETRTRRSTSNVLSILAIVFGAVAALFFPILFGVAAIVLGIVAMTRHEGLAKVGLTVAILGTIAGFVLGALAAN